YVWHSMQPALWKITAPRIAFFGRCSSFTQRGTWFAGTRTRVGRDDLARTPENTLNQPQPETSGTSNASRSSRRILAGLYAVSASPWRPLGTARADAGVHRRARRTAASASLG